MVVVFSLFSGLWICFVGQSGHIVKSALRTQAGCAWPSLRVVASAGVCEKGLIVVSANVGRNRYQAPLGLHHCNRLRLIQSHRKLTLLC